MRKKLLKFMMFFVSTIALVLALGSFGFQNFHAEAVINDGTNSEPTGKHLNVRYETYDYDEYEQYLTDVPAWETKWQDWETDFTSFLTNYIAFGTSLSYSFDQTFTLNELIASYSSSNMMGGVPLATIYNNFWVGSYGSKYLKDGSPSTDPFSLFSDCDAAQIHIKRTGMMVCAYSDVPCPEEKPTISPKVDDYYPSTATQTKGIVILAYGELLNGATPLDAYQIQLALPVCMIQSDGRTLANNAASSILKVYYPNLNNIYPVGYNGTFTGTSDTFNGQNVGGKFVQNIGFQSQTTSSLIPGGENFLGGVALEISTTASGTYKIGSAQCTDTNWAAGDLSVNNYLTSSNFYEEQATIEFAASGDKTNLKTVNVGTGTNAVDISGTATTLGTGETLYEVNNTILGSAATLTASQTTLPLDLAVDGAGIITSIKVVDDPTTGTVLSTATGTGPYNVTLNPNSATTYIKIETESNDGTKTEVIYIKVTQPGEMTALGLSVNPGSSGNTVCDLYTLPNTTPNTDSTQNASNQQYSSSDTTYYMYIANDVASINITPTLIKGGTTCDILVDGTTVFSGVTDGQSNNVSITSSTNNIVIKVKKPDGSSDTVYTINVKTLSADASIANIKVYGNASTSSLKNLNPSGTNWDNSSDIVDYSNASGTKNTSFKLKINTTVSGLKIFDVTTGSSSMTSFTSDSTSVSFTDATIPTAATTKLVTLRVYAQAGNYVDYNITIHRGAASDKKELVSITAEDNNGASVSLDKSTSNTNNDAISSTSNLDFSNSSGSKISSVKFTVNVSPKSSVTATDGTGATITASGSSYTVSFPTTYAQTTLNLNLTVTAEDGTANVYNITVGRNKAQEGFSLDTTSFNVTDPSGNQLQDSSNNVLNGSYSDPDFTIPGKISYIRNNSVVTGIKISVKLDSATSSKAKVKIDGTVVSPNAALEYVKIINFTNATPTADESLNVPVFVQAEYADSSHTKTYYVKATRKAADDDASLTTFEFIDECGNTYDYLTSFDSSGKATTNIPSSNTKLYLKITPNSSLTKVFIGSVDITTPSSSYSYMGTNYNYCFTTTAGSTVNTLNTTILVKTQNAQYNGGGVTYNYSFDIDTLDGNTDLKNIQLFGGMASKPPYQFKDSGGNSIGTGVVTSGTYTSTMALSVITSGKFYISFEPDYSNVQGIWYSNNVNKITSKSVAIANASLATPTAYQWNSSNPEFQWAIGTDLFVLVVSEAGTQDIFTFKVEAENEKNKNPEIAEIEIPELNFKWTSASGLTFTDPNVTVPYTMKEVTVKVTMEDQTGGPLSNNLGHGSLYSGTGYLVPSSICNGTNGIYEGKLALVCDGTAYTYKLKGVAENTSIVSTNEYEITITRTKPSQDKNLTKLDIYNPVTGSMDSISLNLSQTTYYYVIPRIYGNTTINFEFSKTSTLSGKVIDNNGTTNIISQTASLTAYGTGSTSVSINPGQYAKVELDILSEYDIENTTNSPKRYVLYVIAADSDADVNIEILAGSSVALPLADKDGNSFVFNSSTTTYPTITYAYAQANPFIKVTPATGASSNMNYTNCNQVIVIAAGNSTPIVHTVTIKSELYYILESIELIDSAVSSFKDPSQKLEYSFSFIKEAASSEKRLSSLVVKIDGVVKPFDIAFDKDVYVYKLENLGSAAQYAYIEAVTLNRNASISAFTADRSNPSNVVWQMNHQLPFSTDQVETFTITVQAEDGTNQNYTLKFAVTTVTLEQINSISNITVLGKSNSNLLIYQSGNNIQPTINIRQGELLTRNNQTGLSVAAYMVGTSSSLEMYYIDENGQSSLFNSNDMFVPLLPGKSVRVYVQCTAEDATVGAGLLYSIEINCAAADNDSSLSSLKLNNSEILPSSLAPTSTGTDSNGVSYTVYEITINLKNSVTSASLTGTKNNNNATAPAVGSVTSQLNIPVGQTTLSYICTAEDGSYSTYTVFVIRDDETTLSSLELKDATTFAVLTDNDGNPLLSTTTPAGPYSITVPFEQEKIYLDGVTVGSISNLTVTGLGEHTLTQGLNRITITITAKSGEHSDYIVNIVRENGSDDAFILTYLTEDGEDGSTFFGFVSNTYNKIYSYPVTRTTPVFNPTITVSNGATWTIDQSDLTLYAGQVNHFSITVKSQTGSTSHTYKFDVYPASTDKDITNIQILNKPSGTLVLDLTTGNPITFNSTTLNYNLTVSYSIDKVYVKTQTSSSYAKTYIDNAIPTDHYLELNVGTMSYTVKVVSEYGVLNPSAANQESQTYTYTITRKDVGHDATLKELYVWKDGIKNSVDLVATKAGNDGNGVTFTATMTSISIGNLGNMTATFIECVATDSSATFTGAGLKQLAAASGTDTTTYTFTYTITVTAEDGVTTEDYIITLARGTLKLDDDNIINSISVYDSNGLYYLQQSANITNSITIPYGVQSFTISIDKYPISPSKIVIGETSKVNLGQISARPITSQQFTITKDMYTINPIEYTVYAVSESLIDGQKYTIEITFVGPDTNTSLADLLLDGVRVDGFDPSVDNEAKTYTYTILQNRNNNVLTARLEAKLPNNSLSTIVIDSTNNNPYTKVLVEGVNQIIVVVTSQSNDTATYIINVTREYAAPKLSDISLINNNLLDSDNKVITFNPEVYSYYAIVNYSSIIQTLHVKLNNPNHILTVTNSTATSDSTSSLRIYDLTPSIGKTTYTITLTSPNGTSSDYTLIVTRRDKESVDTSLSTIKVKPTSQEIIDAFKDFKFSDDTNEYGPFVVDYNIKAVDFEVICNVIPSSTTSGATYKVLNGQNLAVGKNIVVILITAADGETQRTIQIEVERLAKTPFEFVVDTEATKYPCEQDKNIATKYYLDLGKRDASMLSESEYKSFIKSNNSNVKVELLSDISNSSCNEVILKVTDGEEFEYVTISLVTPKLSFNVNTEAYNFKCTKSDNKPESYSYTIELGKNKANVIEDYSKYITDLSENTTVEVLSDTSNSNCREVIVKVSNNEEIKYVTFSLNIETTNNYISPAVWIMLVSAVILLIIILICVNKDKYGRISNKRKNMN